MNKKILYFLSILTIIIIISACSISPTITVSGRVIDRENTAVSNAMVTVGGKTTYTNRSGYFSLDVRENSYVRLSVGKPGYWPNEENFSVGIFNKHIGTIKLVKKDGYSARVSGYIQIKGKTTNTTLSVNDNTFQSIPLQKIDNSDQPEYVEGEVLVKFKDNASLENTVQSLNTKGTIMTLNNNKEICKVKSNGKLSTEELYEYYNKLENVEEVSYNYIGYVMERPNDIYFPEQWNLHNINMPAAWNIETGSDSVTVAVLDTGYLPHHDLIENIDRVNDWDFVDKDSDAYDDDAYDSYNDDYDLHSHGTHVAGIIGAVGDNGRGIAGVNWKVNILPLRICKNNEFTTDRLIDAIYYAVDNGASVINISLAYKCKYYYESLPNNKNYSMVEEALQYAYNSGVTVVTAAGNESRNYVFYPASSEYTIAVGATNQYNQLANFSNYDPDLEYFVFAPGDSIFSTAFTNDYVLMSGTSMSTPQVSGVAALLVAQGIRDPRDIRERIVWSANNHILDAAAALGETPDYHFYLDVKIFAAYKKGDTYYLVSNITGADYEGKYNLAYVEPYRELEIIAWIDENGDNIINEGDYFGTSEPLSLSNNEHREIDIISLEYKSTLSIQVETIEQINQVLQSNGKRKEKIK